MKIDEITNLKTKCTEQASKIINLSDNKLSTSLIKKLTNWTGVRVVLDRVVKQREIPKNPSFSRIFESELFDVDSLYYYSLPSNLKLLHDYLQKKEFREFIELAQHKDFVTVLLEKSCLNRYVPV